MEGHKGRQSDNIPENMFTTGLADSAETPNCLVPGKDGEPISLTGAVVDRDKFENMKDEYYQLRGWDVTSGLQTKTKLEELGLKDVAQNLGEKGLISVSSKDSN
jgi:aldehyde:ferredoxin oxidoreductase